ncbi:MAG: type VI secretion system lipoprotein TssJ [Nannocystaceae bacterium]|nr:type VI secretion system lipoprotein TssJ [Nannocystaceae bacterium]
MGTRIHHLVSLVSLGVLVSVSGCKQEEPTCEPDSVEWGISLVIGAGERVNPNEQGDPLPTMVRIYQLRGELAAEDVDSTKLWASEKAEDLGEDFLSVDELILAPEANENRTIALKEDATHLMAAGLFRESVGTSWYTLYEIPRRHPESVCARDPVGKNIPDPCFFVYLDRSEVSGGEMAPSGFEVEGVSCAPLGPPPKPEPKRRKFRDRKKLDEDLDDPLRTKELDEKTPKKPGMPSGPDTPSRPSTPSKGDLPSAPKRPGSKP